MTVARSSSGGVAICCSRPVLWMTSLDITDIGRHVDTVAASLRRRAQANDPAALYWLRRVMPLCKGCRGGAIISVPEIQPSG